MWTEIQGILADIKRLDKEIQKVKLFDVPKRTPRLITPIDPEWTGTYGAPLTSTSWDGDAFSTTAKTSLDLSAVFGVPAGVKSVLVYVSTRDSDSANTDTYFILSPNNTALKGAVFTPPPVNDKILRVGISTVPCDANGDVYYQVKASGASTMDIWLEIWGWFE